MSAESLVKPGIYRIAIWPGAQGTEGRVLTATEQGVTLSPPGSVPASQQEWSVQPGADGTVSIQIPARIFPSRSLSYKEAEPGERIILGPVSDFPTREWRIERAPQLPFPVPYFIRVPDKDLIVVISPKNIFPPELELGPTSFSLENAWALEPVNSD